MEKFNVVQNEKYGDWRIEVTEGGELVRELDGNWSEEQAKKNLSYLRSSLGLEFYGV